MKQSTKLGRLLEARGFTYTDLAQTIGVSQRSLHNAACGNSKSRTARQKIANFLGESPWSDIAPEIPIAAGTIIQFRGEQEAAKFVALTASGEVELRKDTVRLLSDLVVRVAHPVERLEVTPQVEARLVSGAEIAAGGRKRLWPEVQS